MAPKKAPAPVKPTKPQHDSAVDEFGPEDPLDESTPTKDMDAPLPERRKAFVDDVPRGAISLGGGTPCAVCGTVGTGVCPVDGQSR